MKSFYAVIQHVWQKKNRAASIGILVGVALASGGATYFITNFITKNYYRDLLAQAHPIFVSSSPYRLLHPLIGIALPSDQFSNNFTDVRDKIESTLAAEPEGTVSRYSFYVRDLNSGNWTGLNETAAFDPASLLKVVAAIALYRQAENQPDLLSTPLTYTADLARINTQLPFALPTTLQVGQSYTVPELLKRGLADSDNGAIYTLLNSIKSNILNEIYQELSIANPDDTQTARYTLTAREYSRFFRILYNGTLNLDWKHSEQILEDLTQSTFVSGLVAGVPQNVVVAHKYGEHVSGANDVELSDCGIVYLTPRPYFICVMVEGKDQETLAGIIAQISKIVYQNISS